MPFSTSWFRRSMCVFGMRDRFEMIRPNTGSVTAKMVQFQTGRDRAYKPFINGTMSPEHALVVAVGTDQAIIGAITGMLPFPAAISYYEIGDQAAF